MNATSATATNPPTLRRGSIHVLRAGTFPASPADITLTEADLRAIALSYRPDQYRAPVVVGHPEKDHPAYGWGLSLAVRADGLWADVEITPELAESVRAGHYGAVSVSLWPPGHPASPQPAGWSLKHIGFLGAVPPAVKGLVPLSFSAAAETGAVSVDIHLEYTMSEQPDAAAQAARAAELQQQAATLAEREQRIAARELEMRRAGWRADITTHVQAGRVLPAEVDGLVALMERLDGSVVTLAEAEQPAGALLTGFLERLPARVDLSERTPATAADLVQPQLSIPSGYSLAEDGLRLRAAALAYQGTHPGIDFVAAVRAVSQH